MIDTHIHLYVEEFDEDRETLIQQALEKGIIQYYLPAIDSSYHKRMLDLEEKHSKEIKLMMGLHPCYVKPENYKEELNKVEYWLGERKFAAIGEIGIDLYWDTSTLAIQQEAFTKQIQWAKQLQLPIVIHTRNSFDEVFKILEEEKDENLYGIFHCFTGTLAQAEQAIALGFKIGIGGVVTFKNGKIDQFLSKIPLQNMVLETDAPYLSPTPFRGKRNLPEYLVNVAEKLATIYQLPLTEIDAITTQNALEVFKEY